MSDQTLHGLAHALRQGQIEPVIAGHQLLEMANLLAAQKMDIIHPDGTHSYWSTHCRHGNDDACRATELAPGVPRRPAQCKTCAAPCQCDCHAGARPPGMAG